jgi:hypothetical protein
MTRKHDELLDRLTRLEQSINRIERSIERIEVATIVRDPSSTLSADAYESLRRQVVAAAGARAAHLHQLARFAQAVASAQTDDVAGLVSEWMGEADLVRVEDANDDRYFDILGGEGDRLRTIRPAYVDATTGRPVLMGQAERVPAVAAADETEKRP